MSGERRPMAHVAGRLATDLVEVITARLPSDGVMTWSRGQPDPLAALAPLDRGGWWAVTVTFEGLVTAHRFATVRRAALPTVDWGGVTGAWTSSLDRAAYLAAVRAAQARIAAGALAQVNICRVLTADLPAGADPVGLAGLLARHHPAPYAGLLDTGREWVVSASPELYLSRDGDRVTSRPIKGTAAPGEPFAAKDGVENVLISEMVRDELATVCAPGSVAVDGPAQRVDLPGLAHLVARVDGRLPDGPGAGWGRLLAATAPPASVAGCPRTVAAEVIAAAEPVPRGLYCGAVGFIDADRGRAQLAAAIRTFHTSGGGRRLHLGTGAGITAGSDPELEWAETELKAQRLVELSSGARGAKRGMIQVEPIGRKDL